MILKSPPGLEQAFQKLHELVYYPLIHKEKFVHLNLDPPKGILLHGPPGVGKSMLVQMVAKQLDLKVIYIYSSKIQSPHLGETEKNLKEKFDLAEQISSDKNIPTILFIDEIDAIAPSRDDSSTHETRIISQLLTLMDGIKKRKNVVVVGATNRPNSIDSALRRPGRLEREVAIELPNRIARLGILDFYLCKMNMKTDFLDKNELVSSTTGYVGADLLALCREAGMHALNRTFHSKSKLDNLELLENVDTSQHQIILNLDDFRYALNVVVPAAKREHVLDLEPVKWSDVGGLEKIQKEVEKAIEWPLKYREKMMSLGARPPVGILLYGPPGCSKTTVAKIIATEYTNFVASDNKNNASDLGGTASFFAVSSAMIFSPYVGDSEMFIRGIFTKARVVAPSVIFFDELDTITGSRDETSTDEVQKRVLSTLLNEMDGISTLPSSNTKHYHTDVNQNTKIDTESNVNKSVLVVGATNRPDKIDSALLRRGRFDKLLYLPCPDYNARKQILKTKLRNIPSTLDQNCSTEIDLDVLAEKTKNFSGADISNLCMEAALIALRRNKSLTAVVDMNDFISALDVVDASITKEQLDFYEKIKDNF
ncbi:hypothetical protein BB559_005498 [Furculomyces boomerangus]|uniref:AAA+ ATPase domain-containing protein n=1 Tax=Furculomyces boomerangus TaxID=61424 RepID=A0A2T9Y8D8_9FUNG|nr:hypothetical protein BB559_005498 [Furculomyces boomerangus]